MRSSRLIGRRNTHQPNRLDVVVGAGFREKCIQIIRKNTRLLVLFPSIHLNKDLRAAAKFLNGISNRAAQLFPVQHVNRIKQRDGIFGFFGLQRSDQAEFQIRIGLAAR